MARPGWSRKRQKIVLTSIHDLLNVNCDLQGGGKDMAKQTAGESKARQTRGAKKQQATRTRKGAGNSQAEEETAELQKPVTKPEQSGKKKVRICNMCDVAPWPTTCMFGTPDSGRASGNCFLVNLLFASRVHMGHAAQSRLAAPQAPADEKPSTGEEVPVAEVKATSSEQAEAPAEEQQHAAGGAEAKSADVQQEGSSAEQLQKQPSEASLEVSATVGMHDHG